MPFGCRTSLVPRPLADGQRFHLGEGPGGLHTLYTYRLIADCNRPLCMASHLPLAHPSMW